MQNFLPPANAPSVDNTIASHILHQSSQFASISSLLAALILCTELLGWLFLQWSLIKNHLKGAYHTVHFKLPGSWLIHFCYSSCPRQHKPHWFALLPADLPQSVLHGAISTVSAMFFPSCMPNSFVSLPSVRPQGTCS